MDSRITSEPTTVCLQGMSAEDLCHAIPGVLLAEARRVIAAVHRDEDPSLPNAGVRRTSRALVVLLGRVPTLDLLSERRSQLDPFVKYALRTGDGAVIETVRIPLEHPGRFSVCVSSQVGCALGCTFCATGRMGLSRNLETWEIVEQVRVVRRGIKRGAFANVVSESDGELEGRSLRSPSNVRDGAGRVHGVVFQGMGEPMANLDRVLAAIRVMSDPSALAIDARNITVCTSGLPSGIRRLADEAPKVRLGLSIGSARPDVRRRLMPIDRAHGLSGEVFEAVCEHAIRTGLSPMWAVTLLAGVNDTTDDAFALADLAHAFRARTGHGARLSVIPYNRIDAADRDPFVRSPDDREDAFRAALASRGVFTHKRYSGGSDVDAACGQLAARA